MHWPGPGTGQCTPVARTSGGTAIGSVNGTILNRSSLVLGEVQLTDGDTFEDMVAAALMKRGSIRCPDCLQSVSIRAEELPCFSGLPG